MAATKKTICQLKVTLQDTAPAVWRRLLVPAEMTLAKLHAVLQDAMGWTDSLLHCFETRSGRYGMLGIEEDADDLEDARKVKLAAVLPSKGTRLLYQCDYGDGWEHPVELEDVLEPDPRHHDPRVAC